jgi:antirestriction protein
MKTETEITPRIYVACLAAYNNGELHGAWIDADQDADAIRGEIAVILTTSPEPNAEEWAIHDYEGFGDHKLSEWEDIDDVAAMAAAIEEHGATYLAALALSSDHEEALRLMDEYCGHYDSDEDFTQQLLEDTDGLPKDLPAYIHIDWEWTAKEIMFDYQEHDGHYFRHL